MRLHTSIGIIGIIAIFLYFLGLNAKELKSSFVSRSGILISLCLILGIIDTYIPSPLPGAKLGLANVIILLAMYAYGIKMALVVDLAKVVLISIFKGNLFGMGNMMSLLGSLLSFLIMVILFRFAKKKISVVVISMLGSMLFNIGQVVAGLLYLNNPGILYYLPILEIIGIFTGLFTGLVAKTVLRYLCLIKGDKANG